MLAKMPQKTKILRFIMANYENMKIEKDMASIFSILTASLRGVKTFFVIQLLVRSRIFLLQFGGSYFEKSYIFLVASTREFMRSKLRGIPEKDSRKLKGHLD